MHSAPALKSLIFLLGIALEIVAQNLSVKTIAQRPPPFLQQTNADGKVQKPQQLPVISSFGRLLFDDNVPKMNSTIITRFRQIDKDGSGEISVEEFVFASRRAQLKYLDKNRTASEQFLNSPVTEDERIVWKSMDLNKDNQVTKIEYINTNIWALGLQITFNGEICFKLADRLRACSFSPDQPVLGDKLQITMNQAAVFAMAQCQNGLSSLAKYDLETCIIQSSCEKIPECFANRMNFQKTIVESSGIKVPDKSPAISSEPLYTNFYLDKYSASNVPSHSLGFLIADLALMIFIPTVAITTGILLFIVGGTIFLPLIILYCLIFGISNFFGALIRHFTLSDYDKLKMPKFDYPPQANSTFIDSLDPKCEFFTYWPDFCGWANPFQGIKNSKFIDSPSQTTNLYNTVEGVPLDGRRCDHGGELWSLRSCKAVTGGLAFGNTFSLPCGVRVKCKPLCFKASVSTCPNGYTYINSSLLLSRVIDDRTKPFKLTDFESGQEPSRISLRGLEIWDRRYVDSLEHCIQYCTTSGKMCRLFVLQAPTRNHDRMQCSLVRAYVTTPTPSNPNNSVENSENTRSALPAKWPRAVNGIFDIVENADESIAKDGRVPPFIVGVKTS